MSKADRPDLGLVKICNWSLWAVQVRTMYSLNHHNILRFYAW